VNCPLKNAIKLRTIKLNKLLLSLIVATPIQFASAATIDTTTYGFTPVGPFGQPNTSTYGQTIATDSTGGNLESFSFYLRPLESEFKAYVYEWDGLKATGSALYESSSMNIGTAFTGYKEITVTPNVNLLASKSYVLFFSTAGFYNGNENVNTWALAGEHYSGGNFVYTNAGNDFLQISSTEWSYTGDPGFGDLAFKAVISSVPEPSAMSMTLLGLALLGIGARVKRNHA
jgi:hypothetical protein